MYWFQHINNNGTDLEQRTHPDLIKS